MSASFGEVRRYATARTWLEECRRWCAARDLDASRGYAEAWLARVALEQGEWDRAVELAAPLTASEPVISRIVGDTVLGRVRARAASRCGGRLACSRAGRWRTRPGTCNGSGRSRPAWRRWPGW